MTALPSSCWSACPRLQAKAGFSAILIDHDIPESTDVREGSDIHVMLALRHSSCQIVVADEQLDGTDMVRELLGKRQRFTHQTGHALAQCVVEALDVIRFPRKLGDRVVLDRKSVV